MFSALARSGGHDRYDEEGPSPRQFPSILEVVRAASNDALPPHTVKTITVTETTERCQQLDPELTALLKRVRPVLAFRNGAVHMGMTKNRDASDDLRAVTDLVDHLVRALGEERSHMYGHYLEAVDAHLDASIAESRAGSVACASGRRQSLPAALQPRISWAERRRGPLRLGVGRQLQLPALAPSSMQLRCASPWRLLRGLDHQAG